MRASGSESLEVSIGKKFTFFPVINRWVSIRERDAPSRTFLKAFILIIA
jgi:hypothetical protein